MATPLSREDLEGILVDARHLVSGAGALECHLNNLVESTSDTLRQADEVLSLALGLTETSSHNLGPLCSEHVAGCTESADALQRVCLSAREQQVKARRLLTRLDAAPGDGTFAPTSPGHVTVVVADDMRDMRDLVAQVLRGAGYFVRTVGNGLEALIAAIELQPAVILMDVSMPVLDGIEATRLIRATTRLKDAKVIAHTGEPTMPEGVQRLFAAIVRKPSPPGVVLAAVQQLAQA